VANPVPWQEITPVPGNYGRWIRWPGYAAGAAPAAIANGTIHPSFGGGQVGVAMADFLWPINRPFNPEFNGVVYVIGSVGISGVVRGQVTIAASGNVLLADDLIYVTAPGSVPDCNPERPRLGRHAGGAHVAVLRDRGQQRELAVHERGERRLCERL
jgi:hypothetical protein